MIIMICITSTDFNAVSYSYIARVYTGKKCCSEKKRESYGKRPKLSDLRVLAGSHGIVRDHRIFLVHLQFENPQSDRKRIAMHPIVASAVGAAPGDAPSAVLKTPTSRALRIQKMWERLSQTFTAERDPPPSTPNPASAALSPAERAKFLTLLSKLDHIKTLHLYNTPPSVALPLLDMQIYPALRHLVLEAVPPSTLVNLHNHRHSLETIEIVNSGITNIAQVFAAHVLKGRLGRFQPMCLPGADYFSQGRAASSSSPSGAGDSSSSSNGSSSSLDRQVTAPQTQPQSLQQQGQLPPVPGNSRAAPDADDSWSGVELLKLRNCGISRLDRALHLFPSCSHIDLSGNDITHIVHLHDCRNLTSLDVSNNRVRVLSNLDRVLGNVITLRLGGNRIVSLDGLGKLYSVETLDLSSNLIDDLCEVSHLARLPCLESVTLTGNPLCSVAPSASAYRLNVFSTLATGTVAIGRPPFFLMPCLFCFYPFCLLQSLLNCCFPLLPPGRPLPVLDGVPVTKREESLTLTLLSDMLPDNVDMGRLGLGLGGGVDNDMGIDEFAGSGSADSNPNIIPAPGDDMNPKSHSRTNSVNMAGFTLSGYSYSSGSSGNSFNTAAGTSIDKVSGTKHKQKSPGLTIIADSVLFLTNNSSRRTGAREGAGTTGVAIALPSPSPHCTKV